MNEKFKIDFLTSYTPEDIIKALLSAYNSVGQDETKSKTENSLSSDFAIPQRDVISIRKRFFVLKRDEFGCVLCGRSGRGVKLEVDHRVPISKGGSDSLDNLQTLCFECNRGKRDSYQ